MSRAAGSEDVPKTGSGWFFVGIAIALAVLVGVLPFLDKHSRDYTAHGDCPERTLCNETAAIDASLREFREGADTFDPVARLVTLSSAMQWIGADVPIGEDPERPVWVVAVRARDFHLSDYALPADRLSDPAADGLWFIWGASGAGLGMMGGLEFPQPTPVSGPNYASVVALQSAPIPIFTPSPEPTFPPPAEPPETPAPTPTSL
jgi:hypothetical protein